MSQQKKIKNVFCILRTVASYNKMLNIGKWNKMKMVVLHVDMKLCKI